MACALLAGCGGTTARDFTAQANAICASTVRQLRALSPVAGSHASASDALASYLMQALPIIGNEATQLGRLKRPDGTPAKRQLLERYLAAVRAQVVAFAALEHAAQTNDARALSAAASTLRKSRVTALADAYGLHQCGAPRATVA